MAAATRVVGGADEKASIERLYLSPYVEEPLNSKVIKKVSYLNKEVVTCFSSFEILYSMYICNERPMYISHIHVYGYGTKKLRQQIKKYQSKKKKSELISKQNKKKQFSFF